MLHIVYKLGRSEHFLDIYSHKIAGVCTIGGSFQQGVVSRLKSIHRSLHPVVIGDNYPVVTSNSIYYYCITVTALLLLLVIAYFVLQLLHQTVTASVFAIARPDGLSVKSELAPVKPPTFPPENDLGVQGVASPIGVQTPSKPGRCGTRGGYRRSTFRTRYRMGIAFPPENSPGVQGVASSRFHLGQT